MLRLNKIGWTALGLIIIGALNWLLVGIFDFDLVGSLFGLMSPLSRFVYALVGISGLYILSEVFMAFKIKWQQTHHPHPV